MDTIKVEISEKEWRETPAHVRAGIIELMQEYGHDVEMLYALQKHVCEPSADDIYRNFYGDEG